MIPVEWTVFGDDAHPTEGCMCYIGTIQDLALAGRYHDGAVHTLHGKYELGDGDLFVELPEKSE